MRKAVLFEEFASRCPYFYSYEKEYINNYYNCNHTQKKEAEEADSGESVGKCYCFSCPLGIEAEREDLEDKTIDWDGLCEDGDGVVHYYNLQNGDGCSGDEWKNGRDSGYAFLPCDTYEMKYENFDQPKICLLDLKSKCNHPITDCANCPVRKEWRNE